MQLEIGVSILWEEIFRLFYKNNKHDSAQHVISFQQHYEIFTNQTSIIEYLKHGGRRTSLNKQTYKENCV